MQNIVIDKPYKYVPPKNSRLWPLLMHRVLNGYLRRFHGVHTVEVQGAEKLSESLRAGHGVLLTPNHCRPCDPMLIDVLPGGYHHPHYTMASWHLFMQNRLQTWLLPRLNVFSVYREGMDGASVKEAISILKEARGPLVIFPEGLINRANDVLGYMNEGPAFMAISAAKQRLKQNPSGRIVIHPVFIRYRFQGDLLKTIAPVLADIEHRLTWTPDPKQPLMARIVRIGQALLDLKEVQYLGKPQEGTIPERLGRLIDHLLSPLESEWKVKGDGPDVPRRVRALRSAILTGMTDSQMPEAERARRWELLSNIYLAQQLALYPPDYIASKPTVERVLETVERFEEDLTDTSRLHAPIHARLIVDDAIVVDPANDKPTDLTDRIRQRLQSTLDQTGQGSTVLKSADFHLGQ